MSRSKKDVKNPRYNREIIVTGINQQSGSEARRLLEVNQRQSDQE